MGVKFTRRRALGLVAAAPLIGCGSEEDTAPVEGTLEWAAAGAWRPALEKERDKYRHPVDTLRFWGLAPGMTVLEIYPGLGWWTAILAPYLRHTGGKLIVAEWDPGTASADQRGVMAAFAERFADARRYGEIGHTDLSPNSGPLTAPNTVDLAIVARNVHTFIAEGFAEKAFRDIAASLKPGGFLGVEQHRARSDGPPDPSARTGYVQEAFVKELAEEAGLEFVGSSPVNLNPKDDHDHPFGVWTLPPELRTAPLGQKSDPDFDTAPYIAIGESDRMTLRFKKPDGEAAEPDE